MTEYIVVAENIPETVKCIRGYRKVIVTGTNAPLSNFFGITDSKGCDSYGNNKKEK